MKKILIIGLTERMGGVETFIYNTTKFSDKEKYEYYYLVHGTNKCVFEEEINDFYGNEKHIFYIDSIKKKPFKVIKELISFYKKNKFDIIHLQTGSCAEIMYVFPYKFFSKTTLITHSHNGNGSNSFINSLFKPFVNLTTNKRLACSKIASKWLFGKGKESVIINNGIDTERFSYNEKSRNNIRKEFKLDKNIKVIGHIGRFSEQKNHIFIVDIFKKYHEKNKESVLMLVGEGELKNNIVDYVNKCGLNNDVIFVGKRMDAEKFYSCFDIFLMPSLYEGLPIVGIEAQSAGLECFFSDTIDKQIKITDRAHIYSLNDGPEKWAINMLENDTSYDRSIYCDLIEKEGYGIKSTVKKLEEEYEVK